MLKTPFIVTAMEATVAHMVAVSHATDEMPPIEDVARLARSDRPYPTSLGYLKRAILFPEGFPIRWRQMTRARFTPASFTFHRATHAQARTV